MKRTIFIFAGIIIVYMLIANVVSAKDIIPDDAIRIRVIGNSNSKYDQDMKYKVKDVVEYDMYNLLKNVTDIEVARELIKKDLPNLENNIYTFLQKEDYKLPFTVNFGLNYFPKKEYKGLIYEEGYYESVVITLGEGLGDNWWCILFPPLCMLEVEETNKTDVEYTTLVKMVIDKYF